MSIAFPPKSDAEGLQVAKYLKYLFRENEGRYHFDALTSRMPTLNMHHDPSLDSFVDKLRQTVELQIYENRYLNFALRKLFPVLVHSPDSKFSFHWQSGLVANLLKTKPDLIYSRSFPASSAVMALKLKRQFQVPWIMHLSDLWADSPFVQLGSTTLAKNQKMELDCFQEADVICLTSKRTLEFFRKKYASLGKRFELFPNVFDSEDAMGQMTARDSDRLRIVHAGSLAGARSPETFLKAVRSLPQAALDKFEVVFVGPSDRKNTAIFQEFASSAVSHIGATSYAEAIKLQRSADVLLLIDTPVQDPDKRVFFPSKLLDYMLTGKPIVALIDEGSEVEERVREGLGTAIHRHDEQAIREHLLSLLEKHQRVGDSFSPREPLSQYDASVNARRLLKLFDEVLKPRA